MFLDIDQGFRHRAAIYSTHHANELSTDVFNNLTWT